MTKRRAPLKRKKPLFSHHKHSGKRLPHHHTGYQAILIMLLIVGLMLAGISRTAKASSDIVVTGRIPAPLPPAPAVISAPANGDIFTTLPIDVQGTCPAGYLVKLNRNDFYGGSVICGPAGTFSIQTDLFVGSNELTAHVYNITDDEGPLSPAVTVNYNPPAPPPAPPSQKNDSQTPAEIVPQLILKADGTYKGYVVGQEIEWQLEVVGGSSPYAISIDWGDEKTSVISRKEAGKFSVSHIYGSPGGYKGSYNILINGSDSKDQKAFLQLLVIVNVPFASSYISSTVGPSVALRNFNAQVVAWITYSTLLIIVGSFWLGESWQYRHMPLQSKSIKHKLRRA